VLRHHGRASVRLGQFRRHVEADRARPSTGRFGRGANAAMIRVLLPYHLRLLAKVDGEVTLEVEGPATVQAVLDALEARFPALRGTLREHTTGERRAYVRFFACEQDISLDPLDAPLPEA